MWRVIRSALAVIVGFVAASAVMLAIESVNHLLYPEIAKAVESGDPAALQAAIAAPGAVGAMVVVLVAWVLASVLGGFVAGWIGRNAPVAHALVVGALLTAGGIANNLMYPPPVWFWVATLAAFLPPAYAGARLAARKREAAKAATNPSASGPAA